MKNLILLFFILSISLTACKQKSQETATSKDSLSISRINWGKVDSTDVYLYTLTNAQGMKVNITNFGGIITSIYTKDNKDSLANIVLGFDSLQGYTKDNPYFGALIGRYANRIAKGKFKLEGKEYKLAVNNGPNALHGGLKGFNKRVWTATELKGTDSVALQLVYASKDMEEGYPGNLTATVTYVLNDSNELKIYYSAETDKPTVVNLTNHSYFNLTGAKEPILNHFLTIFGDSITPVDTTLIPTGKIDAVKGTPFDFTTPHPIGERIASVAGGYDHNFILSKPKGTFGTCAEVFEPKSGRLVQMSTTEPGIQFYSGNFLDGTLTGSGNVVYQKHFGLCLEAQHYPNSPNEPKFPNVLLKPGEKYYQLTIYKFTVKK